MRSFLFWALILSWNEVASGNPLAPIQKDVGAGLYLRDDVPVYVAADEDSPLFYTFEKEELLVPEPGEQEGFRKIQARPFNSAKPIYLYFKANTSAYSVKKTQNLEVKVQPKWKTSQQATLFSVPGKSYLDCVIETAQSICVAWPPIGTPLRLMNSVLVEGIDPADKFIKWRLFYYVYYEYKNKNGKMVSGNGWIAAEDAVVGEKPDAAESAPKPANAPPVFGVYPLPDDIESVYKLISPVMGDCLVKNRQDLTRVTWNVYQSPAFTQTMLPFWQRKLKRSSDPFEDIAYRGRKISAAEALAIDTLARSIYGEMATCNDRKGPQYLMAVAKVVLNRVKASEESEGRRRQFMCNPATEPRACKLLDQPEFVNGVTQVLIKPKQFSTWNNDERAALKRVLCPSGRTIERDFIAKGGELTAQEKFDMDNWQDSLRIAMEAVLDPDEFSKKVPLNALFYVSGRAGIRGHVRIRDYPVVMGRKLDSGRCMKFLRPMTRAEIQAATQAAAKKKKKAKK